MWQICRFWSIWWQKINHTFVTRSKSHHCEMTNDHSPNFSKKKIFRVTTGAGAQKCGYTPIPFETFVTY